MGRLTRQIVLALTAVYLYPRLGPYARFLARELTPTPLTPVEGQRCVAVRGEQRHGAEEAFSGCEDVSMWTREGRGRMDVVAACDPHKEKWNTVMGPLSDPSSSGHLFLVPAGPSSPDTFPSTTANLAPPKPIEIPILGAPPGWNFHPHGTSILHRRDVPDGNAPGTAGDRLMVINWAEKGSVVEVFDLEEEEEGRGEGVRVRWRRTVKSAGGRFFTAPNAIVAVSPTSFYLTHDHLFTKRPAMLPYPLSHPSIAAWLQRPANALKHALSTIETFAFVPGGRVDLVRFAEDTGETIVERATERIPFANGMGISPASPGQARGRYLAVASSVMQDVSIYDTAASLSGRAKKAHTVRLPMLPDNVVWHATPNASTSEIIVAGHPGYLRFLAMLKDTSRAAPSLVVAIPVTARADGGMDVAEYRVVYRDEGHEYPTSTTGDRDAGGRLWVSGIVAKGMLLCDG